MFLATVLAACGGGGGGSAPAPVGVFGPPLLAPTSGSGGRAVVVADVDRDGHADVLLANETFTSVSLLRSRADGGLDAGFLLPAPNLVTALAVGDLDGDRVLDFVAASGASVEFSVSRGLGDGLFAAPRPGTLPWPTREIAVAEVTGDGRLDLVATSRDAAQLAVLPGDGNGWFGAPRVLALPYLPAAMLVADVDGDGRSDLCTTGLGAPQVDVWRNDGAGGWLVAVPTVVLPQAGRLAACDLDGDRRVDLVALEAAGNTAVVLLGSGNGSFRVGGRQSLSANVPDSFSLGDVSGDGRIDLVATAGGQVLAAYGDGAGAFGPVELLYVDTQGATSAVARDRSGDGRTEVVYVSGGNSVGVLQGPQGAPAGLESFGEGSPECRGRIGMWANGAPRVGNAGFGYITTNAPADSFGFLLQGGPADLAGSDPFGLGLRLHLGFGLVSSRLVFSNALGASFVPEPIPASPGLAGLPVHVQTVWQGLPGSTCALSPVALSSSVGLTSTVQP